MSHTMKITCLISSALCMMLGALPTESQAQVVAKYTFDGRTPKGERIQRPHRTEAPFDGEDYLPDAQRGETGPRLINPGSGSEKLYRSFYNNAASKEADGREVLELKLEHAHHYDIYRTPEGEGPLPTDGSFTWEVVARIDGFGGTNHSGLLIDASKGAGRIAGIPGQGADKALTTRLWMKPLPEYEDLFLLCFSVPVDDSNKVVTVSAELKFKTWHHIAAVYNEESQMASLYIDGQEVASAEVLSAGGRSSGFAIGGYGPDVFRVDHSMRIDQALLDAIAFSKGALEPGKWALSKDSKE